MKNLKNDSGLTLLEVLIATLLLTIVLAGTLNLYYQGVHLWHRAEKTAEMRDQLNTSLTMLKRDLRQASDVQYLQKPAVAGVFSEERVELIKITFTNQDLSSQEIIYTWAPEGISGTRNVLRRQARSTGLSEPLAEHISYVALDINQEEKQVLVVLEASLAQKGRTLKLREEQVVTLRSATREY